MKEASFYHLTVTTAEKALPRLLEKVYESGKRGIVLTDNEQQTETINTLLWTYTTNKFLPHGSKKDGDVELQPVYITSENENPNNSEFAATISGKEPDLSLGFSRILDIFDGNNEASLKSARTRWKSYQDKGFNLSYYRQDEKGKWEKQEIA